MTWDEAIEQLGKRWKYIELARLNNHLWECRNHTENGICASPMNIRFDGKTALEALQKACEAEDIDLS